MTSPQRDKEIELARLDWWFINDFHREIVRELIAERNELRKQLNNLYEHYRPMEKDKEDAQRKKHNLRQINEELVEAFEDLLRDHDDNCDCYKHILLQRWRSQR